MASFELTRGNIHMDVRPIGDGRLQGANIYGSGKVMHFNSEQHLRNFARNHNYTVRSFNEKRNT